MTSNANRRYQAATEVSEGLRDALNARAAQEGLKPAVVTRQALTAYLGTDPEGNRVARETPAPPLPTGLVDEIAQMTDDELEGFRRIGWSIVRTCDAAIAERGLTE